MSDIGYYGLDSPYWAYNQPGWKPTCIRCHQRKACKKYNSPEYGSFAGQCLRDTDVKTIAQIVIDHPL